MTYRDILVHVPLPKSDQQIDLAAMFAKQFGAHLTGICSLRETAMLKEAMQNPFIHLAESADVRNAMEAERNEALGAELRFRTAADGQGISHSWQTAEGLSEDVIVHACRLRDLAIVEQCAKPSELLWGPAVQIAISGIPVLIIPRSWRSPLFAQHVVVVWSGRAPDAAAARHALPLLTRAQHVTLLCGSSREVYPSSKPVALLDVLGYLNRHGVKAVVNDLGVSEADAGSIILKAVENANADLIVVGAYGRSRFREWLMGGATRHILEHGKVPVLMVH